MAGDCAELLVKLQVELTASSSCACTDWLFQLKPGLLSRAVRIQQTWERQIERCEESARLREHLLRTPACMVYYRMLTAFIGAASNICLDRSTKY